jgi:hypothetical protein
MAMSTDSQVSQVNPFRERSVVVSLDPNAIKKMVGTMNVTTKNRFGNRAMASKSVYDGNDLPTTDVVSSVTAPLEC